MLYIVLGGLKKSQNCEFKNEQIVTKLAKYENFYGYSTVIMVYTLSSEKNHISIQHVKRGDFAAMGFLRRKHSENNKENNKNFQPFSCKI